MRPPTRDSTQSRPFQLLTQGTFPEVPAIWKLENQKWKTQATKTKPQRKNVISTPLCRLPPRIYTSSFSSHSHRAVHNDSNQYNYQHIQSELNYWGGTNDPIIIDFAKPDGKEKFAEVENKQAKHPVLIHDIRGTEDQYTLETHGFQYFHDRVLELDDWTDEQKVIDTLIPRSEELVRKITGAKETITFTHRIRCFASDKAKLADNRAPAHSVHTDFIVAGALRHLETAVPDLERLKQLLSGRVMIINVWRPLKTVHRDPLAVYDWQSTNPQDIIPFRLVLPQGWNELSKVQYNKDHRWYYPSNQQRDEPLVFKHFDSGKLEEGGCMLPHSAFKLPSMTEHEPRQSIEIKMFAFL